MTHRNRRYELVLSGFLAATIFSSPLHAQPSAGELDALVDPALTPEGGLALARQQAGAGDLLGAAATLERTLLASPDAPAVRAFYAGLLCRLDDPEGAGVELRYLEGVRLDQAVSDELGAACGPAARHGGEGQQP